MGSGLNVLSPKQQLLPDSSVPAVTPISLHDGNDIDLVAKHIAITKPKHKRSKSESSIKKEVAVVLRNGQKNTVQPICIRIGETKRELQMRKVWSSEKGS